MRNRIYTIHKTDEHKFINFSDVLKDARNSLLDDLNLFNMDYPVNLNNRVNKRYAINSVIESILKTYEEVDMHRTLVIVIPTDVNVTSGDLFSSDTLYKEMCIHVVDQFKRKIPIMIKYVECSFIDLDKFLKTGEGEEFLLEVDNDKLKLRKAICSFEHFKKFAKKRGLKYILEHLIDKIEFKRLFVS